MKIDVQWVVDGIMSVEADTPEQAESAHQRKQDQYRRERRHSQRNPYSHKRSARVDVGARLQQVPQPDLDNNDGKPACPDKAEKPEYDDEPQGAVGNSEPMDKPQPGCKLQDYGRRREDPVGQDNGSRRHQHRLLIAIPVGLQHEERGAEPGPEQYRRTDDMQQFYQEIGIHDVSIRKSRNSWRRENFGR